MLYVKVRTWIDPVFDLMQICQIINFRVENLLVTPVQPDTDLDGEEEDENATT